MNRNGKVFAIFFNIDVLHSIKEKLGPLSRFCEAITLTQLLRIKYQDLKCVGVIGNEISMWFFL